MARKVELELDISTHPNNPGQVCLIKSSEKLTFGEYVMFSTGALTVIIADQKYEKRKDEVKDVNGGRGARRYLTYEKQ